MDQTTCNEIFTRLRAQNPNPRSELNFTSPFELLVAVVLSAQATDTSVNRVTKILFPIANTPAALLSLGETQLRSHIKSIGLYRNKAKHLILSCHRILELHNGAVPDERDALEALPGVGRKTANVILNTAFGQPTIAVDTHVFRVANRTALAPGKTVQAVERDLLDSVPAEFRHGAHHWLILHGRYTCTARKPSCGSCIIKDLCGWPDKSLPAE